MRNSFFLAKLCRFLAGHDSQLATKTNLQGLFLTPSIPVGFRNRMAKNAARVWSFGFTKIRFRV